MAYLNWTAKLATLDAALGTATGADLAAGQQIRAELYNAGRKYEARWTASVSTARDAWITQATTAHDLADEAARYVEDEIGTADPPLTFDQWSSTAILARLEAARTAALDLDRPAVVETLERHRAAVGGAFGVGDAASSLYAAAEYVTGIARHVQEPSTVRALEMDTRTAMAAADDWIALVAYS